MTLLKKFWRSIKRNPVINVFVVGVTAQAINHAISVGDFELKNIAFYAMQIALAAIAREFVVPLNEHEKLKESVSKAIVRLEADHQERLANWTKRLKGYDD